MFRHVAVIALTLLTFACATAPHTANRRVAKVTVFDDGVVPVTALTAADTARMERLCFEGCPVVDPDFGLGPTVIVTRDGYVLEHSSTDKIPLWVAEHVESAQLSGNVKRKDKFAADPLLKSGKRSELADYKGSGYDRGHQAPAGNQTTVPRLKEETFFLSNMAPQEGALNQQIWAALEDQTRDWAKAAGSAFILTGGFFYDPAEENPNTADGLVDYFTIGTGAVAVPTHFYKIVMKRDAGGQARAIAFVAENRGYPRPFDFAALIQPIDWIEERTGLNFMPELSAAEEAALEEQASPMW
jgi:endonuclease G